MSSTNGVRRGPKRKYPTPEEAAAAHRALSLLSHKKLYEQRKRHPLFLRLHRLRSLIESRRRSLDRLVEREGKLSKLWRERREKMKWDREHGRG